MTTPSVAERFMEKVEPEPNTGCWLWAGSAFKCGKRPDGSAREYRPHFSNNNRTMGAHRWAYELFVGPIPDGAFICHHCDVPLCVNPEHLYAGDHQSNVDDMVRRRRHYAHTHPEIMRERGRKLAAIGHRWKAGRRGKSIVPHDDIPSIQREHAAGKSWDAIGERYGVAGESVRRLVKREVARAALSGGGQKS